ncbi:Flagellar FliJ protein [Azospirillaceae bacterium]
MKDLRPLIRLHRWQLDEKRRALVELQTMLDNLYAQAKTLEDRIIEEQQAARKTQEVAFVYPSFAKAAINSRKQLAFAISQVEAQVSQAMDDIAEAFQDLKRYELAQEERVKAEKEQRRLRENITLDETAAIRHRRRQEEEEAAQKQ